MNNIMTVITVFFLTLITLSYYILLKREEKKQIEKFVYTKNNSEENILYDSPTVDDKIGFIDYAEVLAESIKSTKNFTVYGIYGPWGSGKTSLMRMINAALPEQTNIWFDAWKFKGKVSIFDALCEILGETLEYELKNRELKKKSIELSSIEQNGKKINYSIKKINEYQQNMALMVNYLNTNMNSKIVIYVDDLDRCNPADAVDFLENLKVFFDVPRISFIIGVNYDILFFEINKRFKNLSKKNKNFTEEYLAKIINIPFFIPMLNQSQIKEYICHNIQNENVLAAAEVFSVGLEGNLRTVKRIVNTFILLNEVANIRKMDIEQILLAKFLIIQYRYKDIYNQILLNPDYLIRIQNSLLRRNHRVRLSVSEIETIPLELKNLLFIPPYFNSNELSTYICLTIEKHNTVADDEVQPQQYLPKIKEGDFEQIPDLKVFPIIIRQEVINTIFTNFTTYEDEQKKKVLELLNGVFDDTIKMHLIEIFQEENIDIQINILLILKNNDINIESYVWKLLYNFANYDEEQKNFVLEFIINLLDEGHRYCIDILGNMFDGINWLSNETLKEKLVKSLGNSHDKKAIDLIDNFIDDVNPAVTHAALNAIGSLDVDALWDYYEKYTLDSNHRGAFFEAIVNHAEKNDTIISMIDYKNVIAFLENETEENGQIAEINILFYLAMNLIDNDNQVYNTGIYGIKEILQDILKCLTHISRYNDKWIVRDKAEKIKEQIEAYKEDNSLF